MNFSVRTRNLLLRAGWKDNRKIDIRPYEQSLMEKGFPVFPVLVEFLERFGGLSFHNPSAKPPAIADWHFRVQDSVRHAFPNNIKAYGRIAATKLSVIGEASRDHLMLMMDESGRIFGGYDDIFLVIGISGEDAIEGLCAGRIFKPFEPAA